MPSRPYDLPAMSALVSFESAARHISFKAAAAELNVTPAAVSHQVKALEHELQTNLFRPHHRGVELTETGAYLLVALQRGFEGMSDAIDQLRARATKASVTIHATTAVSSLWLTPRLAQFWKSHGDISVAQILSDTEHPRGPVDLSIQYGDMSKERDICHRLFRDHIMALGSPAFAAQNPVTSLADLARLPLIHLEAGDMIWTDWKSWFTSLGYTGPLRNSHRVNNYVIALQAAQDDMGAVLGWGGLTENHRDTGKLVPLLPDSVLSPLDYYIKLHPNASERAKLVFDWLAETTEC